jgi:tetratricopeptide (TPR) repeat protein
MGARRELAVYLEAECENDLLNIDLVDMRDTLLAVEKEVNISSQELIVQSRKLIGSSEYAEAEILLDAGCAQFPGDIRFFAERAWLPFRQRNWSGAIERWTSVKNMFPESAVGYLGLATCLRVAGRLDEAETLLADTITLFPNEANAAAQYALIPMDRDNLQEAIRRLKATRDKFPAHRQNRISLIKVAIRLGNLSDVRDEINFLMASDGANDDLITLAVEVSLKCSNFDWLEQIWKTLISNVSRRNEISSQIRAVFDRSPCGAVPHFISAWLKPGSES